MGSRIGIAALAIAALLAPSAASAQRRLLAPSVSAGTGLSLGNGQAEAVARRSPLFVEASLRTWTDEAPDVLLGGALRGEVEGRASIAGVARAELSRRLGRLEVRPGVAIPLFFAPFTMLGVETSLDLRIPVADVLSVGATMAASAFFVGSDVPEGATVLMFNGAVGVELLL